MSIKEKRENEMVVKEKGKRMKKRRESKGKWEKRGERV